MNTTIKPKACKCCKSLFTPARPLARACSPLCAMTLVRQANAKKAKLLESANRKETKAKLEKLKTRSTWAKEAQGIINRYVRVKALEKGEGCYTCGATPEQKFGGTYDAAHFRSVGSAPHLRFWMPQIRLSCIVCNRHKGGELLKFRRALVIEHGEDWVQQLESRQEVAKFTVEYLQRLKKVMSKRLKRLEKRIE